MSNRPQPNKKPHTSGAGFEFRSWLRRSDSNRRPSGYEPDELPLLHSAIELYPRPGTLQNEAAQCVGVGAGDATGVGDGLGGVVTRNVRSLGFA